MELGSNFKRVIGGTEKQKEDFSERVQQQANRSGESLFSEGLLLPTPEEQAVIALVLNEAHIIAQEYGADTNVSEDRIFVLNDDSPHFQTNDTERAVAFANARTNAIVVPRTANLITFAHLLMHVCLHQTSYHSAQIIDIDTDRPYRSGIAMRGREGEGEYFHNAQEGIIAELSYRFQTKMLIQHPVFKDQLEKMESLKDWLRQYVTHSPKVLDTERFEKLGFINELLHFRGVEKVIETINRTDISDEYKFHYISRWIQTSLEKGEHLFREYSLERRKLAAVINRIVEATEEKTVTNDTVFDEFAKAHFSGNYLPLARFVESILGKGSFRAIAIELGNMK